jgi:hypothetical protein
MNDWRFLDAGQALYCNDLDQYRHLRPSVSSVDKHSDQCLAMALIGENDAGTPAKTPVPLCFVQDGAAASRCGTRNDGTEVNSIEAIPKSSYDRV